MKLQDFRPPYPDELFYSVLARNHLWSRNVTKNQTMEDFFGNQHVSPIIGFPSRLSSLSARINHEKFTAMYFVNHTSLFPLFRPFIQYDRAEKILSYMRGSPKNNSHIQMLVGDLTKKNKYLNYCPSCFDEDIRQYGEPYWHRTHQVFGVKVCPIHKNWLYESNILSSTEKLVPLSKGIVLKGVEVSNRQNTKSFYISIAKGVYWILNHNPPNIGLEKIKMLYKTILFDSSFLTYQGNIRFKKLIPKMIDFFGDEILNDMQSKLDPHQKSCWIRGMFKKYVKPVHPIKHLILLNFLKQDIEDFCKLESKEYKPFGNGPWLCLNPFADHYKQPVIEECHIHIQDKYGKPNGTFKCTCGFIYKRVGPDKTPTDQNKYSFIQSYGHVWEQRLLDSILKEGKSFRQLARETNFDRETLSTHFKRLNAKEKEKNDFYLIQSKYRSIWQTYVKKYPDKTQAEIRKMANKEYKWLYRNDKKWLLQHQPSNNVRHVPQNKDGSLLTKNWRKIDIEIANQIAKIADDVSYRNNRPQKITITSISRNLRHKEFLFKNLHRLPLTKQQLNFVLEDAEEYRIRKLKWAITHLDYEHLTRSKILKKACIKSHNITDEIEAIVGQA